MPNGTIVKPDKGTPQGGIISPLLANIVLNELDQWVDSQWLNHPIIDSFKLPKNKAGTLIKSNAYAAMRKSGLKELYIIRYADDFRIFCRTNEQARAAKEAITRWLKERLKLEISEEKTRIINAKSRYMEFLGFKLKLYQKGKKWVVKSHISDKKFEQVDRMLKLQITKLPKAKNKNHATSIIRCYNSKVVGVQNYYCKATEICKDLRKIQYHINVLLRRVYGTHKRKGRLSRTKGRALTKFEQSRYGKSKALRYYKSSGEPIYPIGYVKPKPPMSKTKWVCCYTPEGRKGLHEDLAIDTTLLVKMMLTPIGKNSIEYSDNRLSLFSAQYGKCGITQRIFRDIGDIHCHHKKPRELGGTDEYGNLILVHIDIHRLIHAKNTSTINKYLDKLELTETELMKVNKFRKMAEMPEITV